jgi:hypothetical protein
MKSHRVIFIPLDNGLKVMATDAEKFISRCYFSIFIKSASKKRQKMYLNKFSALGE